jgi:hypothetical protein
MGEVWLPNGPDGDLVLDELARFPAGKHDDEVDAAALIGRALDMAHPALGTLTGEAKHSRRDYGFGRGGVDASWMTV